MPIKRKIKIELNSKEDALVHYEMEWGRNDSISVILHTKYKNEKSRIKPYKAV